jgi:hypothetical protein
MLWERYSAAVEKARVTGVNFITNKLFTKTSTTYQIWVQSM